MDQRFESLFKTNYPGVVRYVSHYGFSAEEAQELAQDTFLRAFRAFQGFREETDFPSWLFTIARNVVRNKIRDRQTLKRSATLVEIPENETTEETEADPVKSAPRDQGQDPLEKLLSKELAEELHKALLQLPPQMRVAAFLRYGHDLKYREIAEILDISLNTVRSHLHQARQRLAPALDRRFTSIDPG